MIEINGKSYDVRPLKGSDVFALLRLLKKANIKEALNSLKGTLNEGEASGASMLDLLEVIVLNLDSAEDEIFDFVASFLVSDGKGIKGKELASSDPVVLIESLKAIMGQEGFGRFFKQVAEMISGK